MKTLESHVLRKRACVVRRGAGGKGLLAQYLACGLPDFVLFHPDKEELQVAVEQVTSWLAGMGLHLHPTKTRMMHTLDPCEGTVGFDFLGFTVRQYRVGQTHTGKNAKGKSLGFKTIITPSQTARKRHTQEIKRLLRKHRSAPQAAVIRTLNPVIRGWTDYYKGWICSQVFNTCEYITFQQLARWEQARHPGKSKHWLRNRYTIEVNGSLRFGTHVKDKAGNTKSLSVRKHTDTLHKDYVKVEDKRVPTMATWSTGHSGSNSIP